MATPVKIGPGLTVYGAGSLDYLKDVKAKKAIICTTPSAVKNGVFARAQGYLKEAGVESVGFFEKELNPSFDFVKKSAEFFEKEQPDLVVAIGGGTVLDAAKIICALYENPHIKTIEQLLEELDDLKLKYKVKTIFVPTTAGSASEASKSGVITNNKTKTKHGIRNFNLMPDVGILDPELTVSLPKSLTAETGMDALTHLVEGYVSRFANPLSDMFSKPCAMDVLKYLPLVYEEPTNLEYRGKMLVCAMAGGYSFSVCSLGLCHGIAHGAGACLNLPHGVLNAITLPHVIRLNMRNEKAAARYKEFADYVGAEDFADYIEELSAKLNIPKRYKDVHDDDEYFNNNLDQLAENVMAEFCTRANPVDVTLDDIKDVLTKAYYGK